MGFPFSKRCVLRSKTKANRKVCSPAADSRLIYIFPLLFSYSFCTVSKNKCISKYTEVVATKPTRLFQGQGQGL